MKVTIVYWYEHTVDSTLCNPTVNWEARIACFKFEFASATTRKEKAVLTFQNNSRGIHGNLFIQMKRQDRTE